MRVHDDVSDPREAPQRLKTRAEFLHVGKGRRWHGKAMTLQAEGRFSDSGDVDERAARFGFTLTKKVGNAVMRNRARRRLRETVRLAPHLPVKAGHDYVIVGRVEAIRMPFEALGRELARAVSAVHERGRRRDGSSSKAEHKNAKSPGRPAPERIRPAP